jgi:Rrf2 family transcriptional regulator, nitric oxide-sensitive transcriptional repressor
MRVTRYTDYSLRVLIYLGLKGSDRSTIREISEAYQISRNHLMKVVQKLASLGYIDSVRGVGGGLTLACPPPQIRIGDVVHDMEPDLALVECMRPSNECVITPACKLKSMLARARESFFIVLNEYTLADILEPAEAEKLSLVLRLVETEALAD